MKHLPLILLLFLLASCTDDVSQQGGGGVPIAFDTEATDSTRADNNERPLSLVSRSFKVWGYKQDGQTVFPGYYVYHQDATGWTYTGNPYAEYYHQLLKYWDPQAPAYHFFATAPYVRDLQPTIQGNVATLQYHIDGTPTATATDNLYYSDLATVPPSQYGREVKMNFRLPLSRVRLRFLYPEEVGPTAVYITGLKFVPTQGDPLQTPVKATVTVSYDLAQGTTQCTTSAPTDFITIREPYEDEPLTHATEPQRWYTVVPYANPDYVLEGTFNGVAKIVVVPSQYMQWQAGHEYTYVFKITDTTISFQHVVDVYNKWQAGYAANVQW